MAVTNVAASCLTTPLAQVVAHFAAAAAAIARSVALPDQPPNDSHPSSSPPPAPPADAAPLPTHPAAHHSAIQRTISNPTNVASEIVPYPHQRDAVRALLQLLRTHGCALLADEPGLGKTYSALFLAKHFSHVLVIAPASLLDMWRDAARRAGLTIDLRSYESLSRAQRPTTARYPLIVFDEAHYLRNPTTRRYEQAAAMAWGSALLFLSATPIHNRRLDLASLLALALGSSCNVLTDHQLARFVVRRRAKDVEARLPLPLPALRTLKWASIPSDAPLLEELVALPPPLPPRDGGRADALVRLSLVRAWCSSDAALVHAIRRRLATAAALEHALASGAYPSRAELRSWLGDADAIQLGFAELLAPSGDARNHQMLPSIAQHADALRHLRTRVNTTNARDHIRFARLRATLAEHPDLPALVFTHSRSTAHAAFRALVQHLRCALLTGDSGHVATGTVSRREILCRFADVEWPPAALGAEQASREKSHAPPHHELSELWTDGAPLMARSAPHSASTASLGTARSRDPMRIDVLIATDVVSEGVNLPRAGIVIHLDLPWTPARLEQRVGRARRLGSSRSEVLQVAIAPPVDATELQSVVRHLSEKGAVAHRIVGHAETSGSTLLSLGLLADQGAIDATAEFCRLATTLSRRLGISQELTTDDPQHPRSTELAQPTFDAPAVGALFADLTSPIAVASFTTGHEIEIVTFSEHSTAPASCPTTPRIPELSLSPRVGKCPPNERSPYGSPSVKIAISTDLRGACNAFRAALAAMPSAGAPTALNDSADGVERARVAIEDAQAAFVRWSRARDAEDAAIGAIHSRSVAHRTILHRITQIASGGRMTRRTLAPIAAVARDLVLQTSGIGGEAALRSLAEHWPKPNEPHDSDSAERWLRQCSAILQTRRRNHPFPYGAALSRRRSIQAILVVIPTA